MQVFLFPYLQFVVMAIARFHLAKRFRVRYLAAITRFHSKEMVQHFVVDDALDGVLRDIASVESGIDPNGFGLP